jgi:hypothetical protein
MRCGMRCCRRLLALTSAPFAPTGCAEAPVRLLRGNDGHRPWRRRCCTARQPREAAGADGGKHCAVREMALTRPPSVPQLSTNVDLCKTPVLSFSVFAHNMAIAFCDNFAGEGELGGGSDAASGDGEGAAGNADV